MTTVPFLCSRLYGSFYDWNFTTIEQPTLNRRVNYVPQGIGLGGSSAMSQFLLYFGLTLDPYLGVDGMFYTRGSAEDYNRYAAITGDPGWSWKNLQSYIRKVCYALAISDYVILSTSTEREMDFTWS